MPSTRSKLVVLDDDPTGTQTVHGIPVLTEWSIESLRAEFARAEPCFYILTNSRATNPEEAKRINSEIARHLKVAAREHSFTVVSRSDSTLRGHFPTETDALNDELGPFDATLLIPFFEAGGRFTINDVHYVKTERLIPVAETVYARDSTFGFRSSNLRDWIEEKTAGRVKSSDVASIQPDSIVETLEALRNLQRGGYCVVNAAKRADLMVLVEAVRVVEGEGRRYLFRTAADFVAARLGLAPRPLLTAEELNLPAGGGLIVVGSHVKTTSEQLERLLQDTSLARFEISIPDLLANRGTIPLSQIEASLHDGRDVVIFTSRTLVSTGDPLESLAIARRVSAAVVDLVAGIKQPPRYLLAKGGITSSDVATKALNIRRAMIEGQLLPGVPVWRAGSESKFPGLCYIVFPGNVGDRDALTKARSILRNS